MFGLGYRLLKIPLVRWFLLWLMVGGLLAGITSEVIGYEYLASSLGDIFFCAYYCALLFFSIAITWGISVFIRRIASPGSTSFRDLHEIDWQEIEIETHDPPPQHPEEHPPKNRTS
jgi:hypothetical protein